MFRRFKVTDQRTGETVLIDVGFNQRINPAVSAGGVKSVISEDDAFAGKLKAMMDRRAARDFIDVDAAIRSGRWSPDDVDRLARWARADLQTQDARLEHMRAGHEVWPGEYAEYGLSREQTDALFARLDLAAETIAAGTNQWPAGLLDKGRPRLRDHIRPMLTPTRPPEPKSKPAAQPRTAPPRCGKYKVRIDPLTGRQTPLTQPCVRRKGHWGEHRSAGAR